MISKAWQSLGNNHWAESLGEALFSPVLVKIPKLGNRSRGEKLGKPGFLQCCPKILKLPNMISQAWPSLGNLHWAETLGEALFSPVLVKIPKLGTRPRGEKLGKPGFLQCCPKIPKLPNMISQAWPSLRNVHWAESLGEALFSPMLVKIPKLGTRPRGKKLGKPGFLQCCPNLKVAQDGLRALAMLRKLSGGLRSGTLPDGVVADM